MPSFVTSSPFLAVAFVVIIILILAFVASRYKVAGANEAIIVAGSRGAPIPSTVTTGERNKSVCR